MSAHMVRIHCLALLRGNVNWLSGTSLLFIILFHIRKGWICNLCISLDDVYLPFGGRSIHRRITSV